MAQETLRVHEWLAISVFVGLLGMLTAINLIQSDSTPVIKTESPHYVIPPTITLHVEGAVENPGPIQVKRKSTVKEALEQVKLLPDADLSKIKMSSKVRKGQVIKIPSKTMLTVIIEDAGSFQVPRGTRVNELPKILNLPDGIDRSKFRSKRRVKDNEKL